MCLYGILDEELVGIESTDIFQSVEYVFLVS